MRLLTTLVFSTPVAAFAAFAVGACQTPPPPTPATSTELAGPAPKGTVLQRARDGAQLFPAREGAGGHDHHHHMPAPTPTPAPAPTPTPSSTGGAR